MPTYYCHNCNHQVSVPESAFHALDLAGEIIIEAISHNIAKPQVPVPTLADTFYPQLSCVTPILNAAAMCCDKPAYSPYTTLKAQREAYPVLTEEMIQTFNERK